MEKTNFIKPANRIANIQPYFFASLEQTLNQLRSEGMDVIRIDMGSPDLAPEKFIIDSLCENAYLPRSHGYTTNGGTLAFRKAIAQYYQTRFSIDLDPQTETIGLIGSKEGLFDLSQVIINPGDLALLPDPGYPVYSGSTLIAGGEIFSLPLLAENNFLPNFEKIPVEIAQKAKIMWLNYPNNPTGAVASLAFFQQAIDFGRKFNIIIAHDAPYVDICFDDYQAPSILEVSGAKEIAVEFNSLSKTYNMAGWRLGMAAGNSEIIRYLATYKSQVDSSLFLPVLTAGITALTSDQSWLKERNKIYIERRNIVVAGLRSAGFEVDPPPAAIYVWAKLPDGVKDSMSFCANILADTGVSMTPGIVYGEYGEGFLRISLGTATDRIAEAMQRIVTWRRNQG